MAKVSVCIVSWNSRPHLGQCLKSVEAQTLAPIEVLLLDNASPDGSHEFVRQSFPSVRLFAKGRNEGFARGANHLLREARGDWMLTLNPDVALEPDYIERLIEAAAKDDRIGALAGMLRQPSNSPGGGPVIDSCGIEVSRSRVRFLDREEGCIARYGPREGEYVFAVCAAAALYRRAMLEDVAQGGEFFDEDFFAYYEDLDLGWRARWQGWRAYFEPRAEASHVRGGSGAPGERVEYLLFRNRAWVLIKNDTVGGILSHLPQLCAYEAGKALQTLATKRFLLRAHWDRARLAPRMWRKRRAIRAKRRVASGEIEQWFVP